MGLHFSSDDHSGTVDISINILEFIRLPPSTLRALSLRLKLEKHWIHQLYCPAPRGLNIFYWTSAPSGQVTAHTDVVIFLTHYQSALADPVIAIYAFWLSIATEGILDTLEWTLQKCFAGIGCLTQDLTILNSVFYHWAIPTMSFPACGSCSHYDLTSWLAQP